MLDMNTDIKKLLMCCFVLMVCFAVTACGGSPTDNADNGNQIEEATADTGYTVTELTPDSKISVEGDYSISGLFTDILSDKSREEGWNYYFSHGTESGVSQEYWQKADGTYTSCEILFNMTGLSDNPTQSFTERFKGVIIFNFPNGFEDETLDGDFVETFKTMAAENEGMEVYDLTPMQDNPGQVDADNLQVRSLDGVILERGVAAKQSLVTDVSKAFYDSWADENGIEGMWAYFGYGDNKIYKLNLREYMEECE